jgi:hypothetical protein
VLAALLQAATKNAIDAATDRSLTVLILPVLSKRLGFRVYGKERREYKGKSKKVKVKSWETPCGVIYE